MLRGEPRTYPLVIAAEGHDDSEMEGHMKALIFDQREWSLMGPTTEDVQMKTFLVTSRGGASAKTLLWDVHGQWDF